MNRTAPPLMWEVAGRVKEFFRGEVVVNGGVGSLDEASALLRGGWTGRGKALDDEALKDGRYGTVPGWDASGYGPSRPAPAFDGVMIGRAAYHDPVMLWDVSTRFCGASSDLNPTWEDLLGRYVSHASAVEAAGGNVSEAVKPLHNVFAGLEGNKLYKRRLDGEMNGLARRRKAGGKGGKNVADVLWGCFEEIKEGEEFLARRIGDGR